MNRIVIIIWLLVILVTCTKNPTNNHKPPEENPYKLVQGGYPDWSPTCEHLAFIMDNNLYLYYFMDKHIEKIIENATEPSFSPDGKKLAFERERKIFTIDLETRQERYIAEGITPSWSENSKWIAFGPKNAQRVLTDGTQLGGHPSPDSSLYYYDLDVDDIVKVIVTNYDSLWIGQKLSMSHPEWAMGDSILLFDTEFGIWKIKREGGKAVLFWKNFETSLLKKSISILELAHSGQPTWSAIQSLMTYFVSEDLRPHGAVVKRIHIAKLTNVGDAAFSGDYSDPSWSPEGTKLVLVRDDWIYVYDISDFEIIKQP
jgi:Tol biopolymer transport system component